MTSRQGSGRIEGTADARVAVVVTHQDRLFSEALVQALPITHSRVDGAVPVDGFERAIQSCQHLRPSVVVAILRDTTSRETIRFAEELRPACPGARLVVIAEDDEDFVRAVEAGAIAVLPTSVGLEGLIDAIADAADGKTHLDAEQLRRAMRAAARRRLTRTDVSRRIEQLTEREVEVLRLVAQGTNNKDIASTLHISIRTVDTHIVNILKKLDVHSKLEAAALVHRHGWLEFEALRDSA